MGRLISGKYFARGKNFCLPLTGMVGQEVKLFSPKVYLEWTGEESIRNFELIVLYTDGEIEKVGWDKYEGKLVRMEKLRACYPTSVGRVFIFDLVAWYKDIAHMLDGEYSMFSDEAKDLVKKFWGMNYKMDKPMNMDNRQDDEAFFDLAFRPHLYYDVVADELGEYVYPKGLEKGRELLNPIRWEEETLRCEIYNDNDCKVCEPLTFDK